MAVESVTSMLAELPRRVMLRKDKDDFACVVTEVYCNSEVNKLLRIILLFVEPISFLIIIYVAKEMYRSWFPTEDSLRYVSRSALSFQVNSKIGYLMAYSIYSSIEKSILIRIQNS
jgi:hypothetical protein